MTEGKMLRFSAVLLLWSHIFSTTVQDNVVLGQCLTTTDTKVPQKNLFSYTIQRKPLFPVDVVRFLTISGKVICSNPSSPWAKRSMKYLDAKNKPQSVSNKIARHSVTVVPKNMSTINATSAQSSTTPICNRLTWEEKRETKSLLTETTSSTIMKLNIRGHATQKTENKTQFTISRTKPLEQDWRGSSETTETFQLDRPTWEKGGETVSLLTETSLSTIMNEPFINNGYFCLKGEKFK